MSNKDPMFRPPALNLPSLREIDWKRPADMIRFRTLSRPHELLERPILTRHFGKHQIALVADPEAAEEILFRQPEQFPKAGIQQKLGHAAFGPGMSGTTGRQNQRQRRAFNPLMSGDALHRLETVAKAAAEAALSRWLEAGRIDLGYEMAELAMQIIWASLLGPGRFEGRRPEVAETMARLYAHSKSDFVNAAKIVGHLARFFEETGRWKTLREDNPLSAIGDPDGWRGRSPVSQDEVRANALVLAASGHVTTGLTLAWTAWFLALAPDHQERIRQEIHDKVPNGQHTSLRQVVNETLRLLPPGAETMRDAKGSLEVDGEVIEPGALVIVSFYALHRHRRLWAKPDQFQPERFSAGSPEPVARAAFLPFSGGPAGCMGAMFAWTEILSVLTTVLGRARLVAEPKDAANVGLTLGACIYPDRPLLVSVHPS